VVHGRLSLDHLAEPRFLVHDMSCLVLEKHMLKMHCTSFLLHAESDHLAPTSLCLDVWEERSALMLRLIVDLRPEREMESGG
jgi:hypothetical protein